MRFIPRAEWGARAPRSVATFSSVERIFVHHTTGASLGEDRTDDWVRSIQKQHMDVNGWADIGYSFLFDDYGNVFEGRGWGVIGAHTVNWNSKGHGFAYLGNGDNRPPEAALEALRWLILESDHRFGERPILGHRDTGFATHCPGDWLDAHRNEIRAGDQPSAVVQPPVSPTPNTAATPVNAQPAFVPAFTGQLLHRGSRGGAVQQFQQRMLDRGWRIGVDGDFGPATEKVVRAFQAEKGLTVDGIVGPATWNAAYSLPVT